MILVADVCVACLERFVLVCIALGLPGHVNGLDCLELWQMVLPVLMALVFHVFFVFGGLGGAACRMFSGATIGVNVGVPSICLCHGGILSPSMVGLLCRNNTGGSIEKVTNVGRWEMVGLEWLCKGEA